MSVSELKQKTLFGDTAVHIVAADTYIPVTMKDLLTQWSLASDAMRLCVVGGGFWLFAAFAGFMERWRGKERPVDRLEKVGWVPWLPLFLMSAVIGGGCLALGLPAVLAEL